MLVGVVGFLGSEVVLSPVVSGCLPSCGGWVLVGVAASRTKTFRNQNHRFQSKFAYCKLFGVYAGVIFLCRMSSKCRMYIMNLGWNLHLDHFRCFIFVESRGGEAAFCVKNTAGPIILHTALPRKPAVKTGGFFRVANFGSGMA